MHKNEACWNGASGDKALHGQVKRKQSITKQAQKTKKKEKQWK